jgi:histidinol-phosphate aminotransferase
MADEVTAHVSDVARERDRVAEAVGDLGLASWPSAANFVLFRSPVDDLFDRLLRRGVLIRDFSDRPRLEGCLRVTIGTRDENDRFLDALHDALRHSGGDSLR